MSIQGKTIVFTGKISQPRHIFQRMVEEHGGIAGLDVTKSTDYLVVGEKPGSKLVRASMYGVKTLSEGEFLSLLKDEDEEAPLSFAELEELKSKTVTLTCDYCGRTYEQWAKLPNYETCQLCELKEPPRCTHCDNHATFAEDIGYYHCLLCGTWFKGPFSFRATKVKHLHMFVEKKKTEEGAYKQCPCGYIIFVSNEDLEHSKRNYEMAPQWVREWRLQNAEILKEQERRIEALKIIENLTPEQILYLESQL